MFVTEGTCVLKSVESFITLTDEPLKSFPVPAPPTLVNVTKCVSTSFGLQGCGSAIPVGARCFDPENKLDISLPVGLRLET